MIFQLELKHCSLQRISFLLSILPPAFPKGSTSLSPHELEAHSQLIFFISSKNGSKLNAVHYRKLSNSDDIFSSFLYRIQLQTFYLSFLKKLQLAWNLSNLLRLFTKVFESSLQIYRPDIFLLFFKTGVSFKRKHKIAWFLFFPWTCNFKKNRTN